MAFLTLFVVLTMNFFLFRVLPGSAVTSLARDARLTASEALALKKEFGLNRSVAGQYVAYLDQLVHGNLGISYETRRPVVHDLLVDAGNTIPMVGVGTLIAVLLGISTGLLSAWRHGGPVDSA
ncbi:MAG: ABC transporter permease, partial [Chloroflexi bacterium]|nr:ABC transporter permease [Chloroflexota bacterium]